MRIAVIGAGRQSKAICHVLSRQTDITSVVIADVSRHRARALVKSLDDKRFWSANCDALNYNNVKALLMGADAAICAATYEANYVGTIAAIESGCHFCDLGGNNDIVSMQIEKDHLARSHGVAVVPDCGLAPGLASVLTAHAVKHDPTTRSVRIRCGGIPQRRDELLDYSLVFSVQGLINEYVEDVVCLRDGKQQILPSLEEFERIRFPQPFGELEAFTTSGGISTLPKSFGAVLRDIDYKTIRYPGHGRIFRALKYLGMLEGDPRKWLENSLSKRLPTNSPDVVLMRVKAIGDKIRQYQIIDYPQNGLSAMERMTGFPAALVLLGLARGEIGPGVRPQELCVDPDKILKGLGKLGVEIVIS